MDSIIVKKADSENDWLAKFRQGDETIFREVYETHKAPIYSYSIKRLNYSFSEAEDMTALAFIRLWENRKNIQSREHIAGFLFKVARNAITNHHVRNKRRINALNGVKAISTEAEDSPVDFERMHAEMISRIKKEIEELPKLQQEIFKLYFFGKKSGKEIAQELGLSEASVSREKNSAHNSLRSIFLRKGFGAAIPYFLFLFSTQ